MDREMTEAVACWNRKLDSLSKLTPLTTREISEVMAATGCTKYSAKVALLLTACGGVFNIEQAIEQIRGNQNE